MKKIKIIIICYVFIVLLCNVIPRFKIKSISFEPESIVTVDNILDNPLNDRSQAKYDIEIDKDAGYIVSYTRDQLYCYEYGIKCNYYKYNSTQIKRFDKQFNELAFIEGDMADDLDIVFNNIVFIPYNLAQLNNGNIAAFGKAIDLETEILHPSIFVMNSDLEIIDSLFLDFTKYQFENNSSGHEYFEVISSDDSGFTVKYTDLFKGSIVIHINNDLEEEWYIKYDDTKSGGMYVGGHLANYTETLFYTNETYYVIIQEQSIEHKNAYSIYSYDKDGNLKWKQAYDFFISDVSVIEDDIIISGWDTTLLFQTKNLLIKDEQQLLKSFITGKIKPENGSLEWKSNYYFKPNYNYNFSITNTIKDDDGYYYTILQDGSSMFLTYHILILKYDESGNYVGESLLKGSYNAYGDIELDNKADIRLVQNTIQILTPTTSIYREIDLDNISFSDTMPVSFKPAFYHVVISIRLLLNRLTALIIIGTLGFVIIRKLKKQTK